MKSKNQNKKLGSQQLLFLIFLLLTTTSSSEELEEQPTCAYFNFTFKDGKKVIKPGAPEMLVMNGALPIKDPNNKEVIFSTTLWSTCVCHGAGGQHCSKCEIRRCISNIICNYGGTKKLYEGVICNLEYIDKKNKVLSTDKCPVNPQECLDSQGLTSGVVKVKAAEQHHVIMNGLKEKKIIQEIQKKNKDIITEVDENMY